MRYLISILLSFPSICIYAQDTAKFRITYSCDAEAFVGKKENIAQV
ncbi:MAG: hypothetical protein SPK35_01735 [Prevotella sp.]|nr:hypothetical protein [Prevotella sp.]